MKDTKTSIIECAFRLFLERGYENASMSDLVTASGLSKGAVYHHFKDKDALHDAAIEYFFVRFFEPEETAARPGSDANLEQIIYELCAGYERLIAEIATFTTDVSAYYRFIFSILPKVKSVITLKIATARAEIAAAVRQDQEAGRLRSCLLPDVVADQCLALIEGGGLLCMLEGKETVSAVFQRTIPRYLRSLQDGR